MPSLGVLWPYLLQGLALGGVYAVTGTGLVVLYRTTGVVNLAFGAIGAFAAHVGWTIMGGDVTNPNPIVHGVRIVGYPALVAVAAAITMLYGVWIAPKLARRDPLAKALGMAGVALFLLGIMRWKWDSAKPRTLTLPTRLIELGGTTINSTQIAALVFALLVVVGVNQFLKRSATGTAMRAIANDRDAAALLGVNVRKVEAMAWLGSGVLCGCVFIMLPVLFRSMDQSTLTWFIIGALGGAIVAQFRSLWITFIASLVIGVVESGLTPFDGDLEYLSKLRKMAPFIIAVLAVVWISRKRTVVLAGREMQ